MPVPMEKRILGPRHGFPRFGNPITTEKIASRTVRLGEVVDFFGRGLEPGVENNIDVW